VQIGQQAEKRHRQRDVRVRDAFGRTIARGDRLRFFVEPVDVVILGVEAMARRGCQLGHYGARRTAVGEPSWGVTAVTIEIVERLSEAREIRMTKLYQDAACDQCANLVAIRRTRRLRRHFGRGEQQDERSHPEQQDLQAVAAHRCRPHWRPERRTYGYVGLTWINH